jgi:hypothetical protein
LRPPCPPWRRARPPAARLDAAQPWRPELGRGARRGPDVLRRPALAASSRPWPRRGFGAVRSPVWLGGLLAQLACVACPRQRPTWFARVARPQRGGVAPPLASQLACGSPRGLLVAACSARGSPSVTCSQQHLARVRSSGPRPRSLARVACSPM